MKAILIKWNEAEIGKLYFNSYLERFHIGQILDVFLVEGMYRTIDKDGNTWMFRPEELKIIESDTSTTSSQTG